ncbi:TIGR03943 family protein [Streptomyces avermitilis]|uniref:Membrane protein n=1 Tax=Streptomyces avermitilis TaxID=33903 RepID=A0A4D4M8G3_STRAX|nr:TIGR03943 family protein [Streptomyces avermitilis]OOV21566.1 TIGR03943 family protein [Streptomyces avermitilis]GDY68230.1 membrane protein [Streptomyces avermitilis]GDY71411.1 membrane protein [Streptomyces avermitilis]
MKRLSQVLLLVLSGLGVLHASLFTELYLRYVKEGMRPLLIASGAVLLVLGVAEAWSHRGPGGADEQSERPEPEHHTDTDTDNGHDHSKAPRVAWLLFLPALSLLLYAPPALGAYTASREAPKAVSEQEHFDPLPATSPVPMTLTEFTSRVQQDREQVIKGRSVQMTGFVTPDKRGDGWYLTRIIISCCAADAQSVKVRIHGGPALPANTWVSVTGTWHPGGTLGTRSAPAALDARTAKKVIRPVNAYTDALPLPTTR